MAIDTDLLHRVMDYNSGPVPLGPDIEIPVGRTYHSLLNPRLVLTEDDVQAMLSNSVLAARPARNWWTSVQDILVKVVLAGYHVDVQHYAALDWGVQYRRLHVTRVVPGMPVEQLWNLDVTPMELQTALDSLETSPLPAGTTRVYELEARHCVPAEAMQVTMQPGRFSTRFSNAWNDGWDAPHDYEAAALHVSEEQQFRPIDQSPPTSLQPYCWAQAAGSHAIGLNVRDRYSDYINRMTDALLESLCFPDPEVAAAGRKQAVIDAEYVP